MATQKQIQANRNNARKSTGPQTQEGKTRASQNALKHGLLARDAVLPGEDPEEFEALLAELEADIQPGGAVERELVRQIADAQWRLRRLTRLETGYLAASLDNSRRLSVGERCKNSQSKYDGDTLLLGYSLMQSTQVLAHFARYDAHLSRRFERALRQLAWLRDAREKGRHDSGESPSQTTAPPANGHGPRPAQENGAPPPPTDNPASSPLASEKYDSNPISPNSHGINPLKVEARTQIEPVTPVLPLDSMLNSGGDPRDSRINPTQGGNLL
jgi:hypothetical protein